MKDCFLSLLFIAAFANAFSANGLIKEEGIIKIVSSGKYEYAITSSKIYESNKGNFSLRLSLPDSCSDAVGFKEVIYLATENGISEYNTADNTLKGFMPSFITGTITHVCVDALGRLWFSKKYAGCYMVGTDDKIYEKVNSPAIFDIIATPDSAVWVGTNIGLYKIPPAGEDVFRYEEEGIEGFELPDNYVEQIYSDENCNVWAVMPDYLSFIPAKEADEIPSYNHIGSAQNKVFNICKIPVSSRSYLFATAEGLMYTTNLIGDQVNHSGEIHQNFKENAFALTDEMIAKPAVFRNSPVKAVQLIRNEIYFITGAGAWNLKSKNFLKQLKNANL